MQPTSTNAALSTLTGSARAIVPLAPSPSAPTLLATRLQLELLLSGRTGTASVDLREAAGILLNDLGATLEIFRLAGQSSCSKFCRNDIFCEHRCSGEAADGSVASRLEDCLASLGTEAWLEAVCANAVERVASTAPHLAQLTAFWEHARSIAYACWILAEQDEDVCPEEAYLVGLFHEAARLPVLLGWQPSQFSRPPARLGVEIAAARENSSLVSGFHRWTPPALAQLAAHFRLPAYLACLVTTAGGATRWKTLLETAHAWSREGSLPLPCSA